MDAAGSSTEGQRGATETSSSSSSSQKRKRLPEGWQEKVSKKNGKVYYWNTVENK